MNKIEGRPDGKDLIIDVEGRIDSSNSQKVVERLIEIAGDWDGEKVIINAEKLDYISSAGLRVLLRLAQTKKDISIVNVSSKIYEVFDVTGFTQILNVEKAYRVMSVEGCKVIGEGANGRVYKTGDEIVKVYFDKDALPAIKRERSLAQTALVLGIPTAIPWDVVRVGDGYGSVFELLNAKSYADLLIDGEKTVDEIVAMGDDILKKLHSTETDSEEITDMKYDAIKWAEFLMEYLPDGYGDRLYKLIDAVPENRHLLHGDFHIKNVLVQDDESLLIDMDTLCTGDPIFELGGIYSPYVAFSELDHDNAMQFFGITYETACEIWSKSLRAYLGTDDKEKLEEVEDKARLLANVKIMRRTIRRNGFDSESGRKRIEVSKQHIVEMLNKINSLAL